MGFLSRLQNRLLRLFFLVLSSSILLPFPRPLPFSLTTWSSSPRRVRFSGLLLFLDDANLARRRRLRRRRFSSLKKNKPNPSSLVPSKNQNNCSRSKRLSLACCFFLFVVLCRFYCSFCESGGSFCLFSEREFHSSDVMPLLLSFREEVVFCERQYCLIRTRTQQNDRDKTREREIV